MRWPPSFLSRVILHHKPCFLETKNSVGETRERHLAPQNWVDCKTTYRNFSVVIFSVALSHSFQQLPLIVSVPVNKYPVVRPLQYGHVRNVSKPTILLTRFEKPKLFFEKNSTKGYLEDLSLKGVLGPFCCHLPLPSSGHHCLAPGLWQRFLSWSLNPQFPPPVIHFRMAARMNFYNANIIMSQLKQLPVAPLRYPELLNRLRWLFKASFSLSNLLSLRIPLLFPILQFRGSRHTELSVPQRSSLLHLWAFEHALHSALMALPTTSPHPSAESLTLQLSA